MRWIHWVCTWQALSLIFRWRIGGGPRSTFASPSSALPRIHRDMLMVPLESSLARFLPRCEWTSSSPSWGLTRTTTRQAMSMDSLQRAGPLGVRSPVYPEEPPLSERLPSASILRLEVQCRGGAYWWRGPRSSLKVRARKIGDTGARLAMAAPTLEPRSRRRGKPRRKG